MQEIGTRMRAAREALELTQLQMAHKMGCSQTTISTVEGTGIIPRVAELERWARAYRLSIDDLIPQGKRQRRRARKLSRRRAA